MQLFGSQEMHTTFVFTCAVLIRKYRYGGRQWQMVGRWWWVLRLFLSIHVDVLLSTHLKIPLKILESGKGLLQQCI